MFIQEIKIKALSVDGEEIQFQSEITNGINGTLIDFYNNARTFQDFGKGLLTFPQNIDDTVQYERGEAGEKWAYYILLKAFCYERNGYSAIHVKIDNSGRTIEAG